MANLSSFYQLFGDVPNKTLKGLDPTSTSALFSNARGQDVYLLASSGVENRGGDVVLSGGRGGVSTDGSALGGAVSIFGGDAIATGSIGGLVRIYGGDSEAGETGSVLISSYYNAGTPNVAPTITLGSFAGEDGGGITITTGLPTSGFVSGSLSILTNTGVGGGSGEIEIYTGQADGLGVSGAVSLYTGDALNETGAMTLSTGDASNLSGVIQIKTGESETSGSVGLLTGAATLLSGNVIVASGDSSDTSGVVNIYSGDANDESGSVSIHTGDTVSVGGGTGDLSINTGGGIYSSGGVTLETGASNRPGDITIQAGDTTATTFGFNAGDVSLIAGNATGFANAGDIYLVTGSGGSTPFSGSLDITASFILWDSSSPTLTEGVYFDVGRTLNLRTAVNGSAESGDMVLTTSSTDTPGDITIQAGESKNEGSGFKGGDVSLIAGNATGLANAGDIYLVAGSGATYALSGSLDITAKTILWDSSSPTLTDSVGLQASRSLSLSTTGTLSLSGAGDLTLSTGTYYTEIETNTLAFLTEDSSTPLNMVFSNTLKMTANNIVLENKDDPTTSVNFLVGDFTNSPDASNAHLNLYTVGDCNIVAGGPNAHTTARNLNLYTLKGDASLLTNSGDVSVSSPSGNVKLTSTAIPFSSTLNNRLLQVNADNIVSALGFKFEIVEVGSVSSTDMIGGGYFTRFLFPIGEIKRNSEKIIFSISCFDTTVEIQEQLYFYQYYEDTSYTPSQYFIELRGKTYKATPIVYNLYITYILFNI